MVRSAGIRNAHFYPRPPRGGRPCRPARCAGPCRFLSTPSARRATEAGERQGLQTPISIHALREEGDRGAAYALRRHQDFYPRPPRGGRRSGATLSTGQPNFYPRPPRGGRRCPEPLPTRRSGYFYPRPPRGGRPKPLLPYHGVCPISIHALREEGDGKNRDKISIFL